MQYMNKYMPLYLHIQACTCKVTDPGNEPRKKNQTGGGDRGLAFDVLLYFYRDLKVSVHSALKHNLNCFMSEFQSTRKTDSKSCFRYM